MCAASATDVATVPGGFMQKALGTAIMSAIALFGATSLAQAQAPAGPPPLAIPNPTYVSLPLEVTVNKPAAEVWKRVGKYCDIAEWLRIATGCTIISGKDG